MKLVDAHNHLQDPRFGEDLPQVLREMQSEGIRHAVVNGTRESDWQSVLSLCSEHTDFLLPALGLHPWYVSSRSEVWIDDLRHGLDSATNSSIGECGLDLWKKPADLKDQLQVLQVHFDLAREMCKPLTIHCLKAWQPLLDALKRSAPLPPFLLHSFGGPTAMLESLVKLGAYFSLSGYFLSGRKIKALRAFAQIPFDRILIESDAPDMAPPIDRQGRYHREAYHHPADLMACVHALAELRQVPADECAEICWENTAKWLGRN
jgi:TatD DNase family protein